MFHDIKQYSEDELKKIRSEILAWIEKNEKKKDNKDGAKKIVVKGSPENINTSGKPLKKTEKAKSFIFSYKLKWAIYSLITVISVMLLDMLGIYVFHLKNPAFVALNKFLPFPAMKIDSTYVSYSEFVYNSEKLKDIASIPLNEPTWYSAKKSVQDIYLRFELLNFFQKKYSLLPDYRLAGTEAVKLYEKYNTAKENIFDAGGITAKDIEKFIILPQMIENRLLQKYQKQSPAWSEGKKIVEKFIDNVKNNKVNYDEARLNVDSSIVLIENDMGFIEKGVGSYAFDDSIFDLPAGGISSLYEDERGLHIYIITDRFMEINMVKVKDIIFLPEFDFEKVFTDDTKNIIIKNYIE